MLSILFWRRRPNWTSQMWDGSLPWIERESPSGALWSLHRPGTWKVCKSLCFGDKTGLILCRDPDDWSWSSETAASSRKRAGQPDSSDFCVQLYWGEHCREWQGKNKDEKKTQRHILTKPERKTNKVEIIRLYKGEDRNKTSFEHPQKNYVDFTLFILTGSLFTGGHFSRHSWNLPESEKSKTFIFIYPYSFILGRFSHQQDSYKRWEHSHGTSSKVKSDQIRYSGRYHAMHK